MTTAPTQTSSDEALQTDGVEGNSRLTGMVAAILLVVLAIEGATLLDVGHWMSVHAFIGLALVPIVLLKLATTGYRMVRYYLGDEAYRHRGPPHWLLRSLGPIVVVSTISLLGTGIALIADGHGHNWLGDAHRASFVIWFGVMVIHVLGHLTETGRLATADLARSRSRPVRGTRTRATVVALTLVAGLGLGAATIGWVSHWRRNDGRPARSAPAPSPLPPQTH